MTYNSLNGTTVNNHRGKYIFLQFQSLDHLTSWTSWGPYKKSGSVNQNVGISVRLKRNGSNLIAVPKARLVVHGAMGCGQESFKLVWRCHQLLSVFLVTGLLPRVSRQSHLSISDESFNEVVPGALHISLGICLTAEENPEKPQLGDRMMKTVRPVIVWNGVPYLQMRSVGSQHVRKGEGGKKGKDGVWVIIYF